MIKHSFPTGDFYLGDCLEVMRELHQPFDMVLADLPYGVTRNPWDSVLPLDLLWANYNRLTKPKRVVALTSMQPFTTTLIASNQRGFSYVWYWKKNRATGVLNAKRQPLRNVEEVCIFGANNANYRPQGLVSCKVPSRNSKKDYSNYGAGTSKQYVQEFTSYPKQFLEFDSVQRTMHPNQKPVELFEYLIRTYTDEGELVLDNTAGSGTTAVAAIRSGRRWVCIESDATYTERALKRIEAEYLAQEKLAA